MNRLIIQFVLILLLMLSYACKEQAPTELIYDQNEVFDIERLSPDPDVYNYSNGYDSTGIVEPVSKFSTIVHVNGIKTTTGGMTVEQYYAAALFSDKTQPVMNKKGRLLGYRLKDVGRVFFDNQQARIVNRRVGFYFNDMMVDTLLGPYYELRERHGPMHQRVFPYDGKVNLRIAPVIISPIEVDIPTPKEITGELRISGSRRSRDVALAVEWNGNGEGFINIIIGGVQGQNEIIPFFRINKVYDDGSFIVPIEYLKNIPFDKFGKLVVTLERQKELSLSNDFLNDNIIQGKSIHNIIVNVP